MPRFLVHDEAVELQDILCQEYDIPWPLAAEHANTRTMISEGETLSVLAEDIAQVIAVTGGL